MERINELIALASKLPSGLNDSEAAFKLNVECGELQDALTQGDLMGALTEIADITYYACKVLDWACGEVNITIPEAFDLAIAKYRLRATPGNPKDDELEREAVWNALRFGLEDIRLYNARQVVKNMIETFGEGHLPVGEDDDELSNS